MASPWVLEKINKTRPISTEKVDKKLFGLNDEFDDDS